MFNQIYKKQHQYFSLNKFTIEIFFIINLDTYLVSQIFIFFHIHLIKLQIILLLILSKTTCDSFPYTFLRAKQSKLYFNSINFPKLSLIIRYSMHFGFTSLKMHLLSYTFLKYKITIARVFEAGSPTTFYDHTIWTFVQIQPICEGVFPKKNKIQPTRRTREGVFSKKKIQLP